MSEKQACLIIGAGDDTGSAIARAFANEGLIVCLVRRARHGDALEALAQSIRDSGGEAIAMPTQPGKSRRAHGLEVRFCGAKSGR